MLLGATWCARPGVTRRVTRRLVRHLANRTIPDDTRSYRSALKRRRTSNKATISELRTTAGTGFSPIRLSAPGSGLTGSGLADLALDARAALRHSVGTPIPISQITRSLIRKHRLHAQRKKDDQLRRSRNTLFAAQ